MILWERPMGCGFMEKEARPGKKKFLAARLGLAVTPIE